MIRTALALGLLAFVGCAKRQVFPPTFETVPVVSAPVEEIPLAVLAEEHTRHTHELTVLFDFDHAALRAQELSAISSFVENCGGMYDVVGAACPIGSDEYNCALSEQRARTVAAAVTRNGGRVLSVSWCGESCLATEDPAQYALNRRAVIRCK